MSKPGKKGKPDDKADEVPDTTQTQYQNYFRQSVEDVEEGEQIAVEIMEEVFDKACMQMINNYFDHTAVPYTVQSMCKEMLDLIQFIFVGRDNGDETEEDAASWLPDEEPESVAIDSWARGAVPVRRRVPTQIEQMHSLAGSRVSSPGSRSRPRTQERLAQGARTPQKDGKDEGTAPATDPANSAAPSEGAAADGSESNLKPGSSSSGTRQQGGRGGRGGRGRGRQRQQSEEKIDPEKLAAIEAKKAAEEKRLREAEEAAKTEKLLKELKASGRDFTIDSVTNRVIPIRHMDPKRMPNKKIEMKVSIEEERLAEEARIQDEIAAAAAAKQAKAYSFGKRNQQKKRKAQPIPTGTWLQPEDTNGPMVEEVNPAGGVCVRDGDNTKRSELKAVKNHMSKQDYRKLQDASGFAESPTPPGPLNVTQPGKDAAAGGRGKEGSNIANPPATAAKGGADKPTKRGNQKQQERENQADKLNSTSETTSSHSPSQQQKVEDIQRQFKPQSVAPIPGNKGNTSVQMLGDRPKYPKERGHIHRSVMTEPKHLPAPVYPAVSGHGMAGVLPGGNELPHLSPHMGMGAQANITTSNERLAMDFLESIRGEED
eukprot:TRINITY_DN66662_c2_g1_i1.p1 TRINITY_DN66662_c2_g1~~TRINITY_DN66662_c2_g1_i1.p1  ORF type:complete len:600 (+),score=100.32 TRINITY_DN66662_c2_g1_i1:127-1926(+)